MIFDEMDDPVDDYARFTAAGTGQNEDAAMNSTNSFFLVRV